jgi:hypothetical protein
MFGPLFKVTGRAGVDGSIVIVAPAEPLDEIFDVPILLVA